MKEQTILFKDNGVFYTVYKNENKPKVVLLHPYGSSGKIFNNIIPSLKNIVELIVIDLPSHGKSKHSKNVTMQDMPEIILAIFKKEKIKKVHFIGISEGSLIAQAFSEIYLGYTQSLVSISSYSIFFDTYKVLRAEDRFNKIKLFFMWLLAFKKYKNYFINKSSYSETGKLLFKESMENFKRKAAFSKRGIKRFYNLNKSDNLFPTYIVCGNEDLNVIKDASVQYENRLSKTILEGYKNAKQVVFLDNPRLFVDRIKSFILEIDER